jgi:FkbM family methyltransferase
MLAKKSSSCSARRVRRWNHLQAFHWRRSAHYYARRIRPDASGTNGCPLRPPEFPGKPEVKTYEGEYFLTAVGARDGTAVIDVLLDDPGKSSFLQRTELTATSCTVEKREVSITTLDTLMRCHNLQAPFGLKIDTEGFEYQVIEGAPNFPRKTELVIADVSIAKRFQGSYLFSDPTDLVDCNEFFLWDVLNIGEEVHGRRVQEAPG